MKNNHWIITIFILCMTQIACRHTSNSDQVSTSLTDSLATEQKAWEEAAAKAPQIPLNEHVTQLNKAAQSAWQQLNEADQQKFAKIDLIIAEFTKIKKVNKELVDSVAMLVQTARKVRYTTENMGNVSQLDSYDNTLNLLMDKLDRLETNTSYLKSCKDCMQIFEEIRQMDSQDVVYRSRYTSAAQELNTLLAQKKQAIEALGENFKQIKSYPLFATE